MAANRAPLDWLNVALADVQGGVGPFVAVFLASNRHWEAGTAGVTLTVAGITAMLARAPLGQLVDVLHAKRTLIALASVVVAAAAISVAVWPSFEPVMRAQVANGAADAVFAAAIAAISLGIVGRARFTARVGRNEPFNHAGNMVAAIAAGIADWLIAPSAVLWIVAALALPCHCRRGACVRATSTTWWAAVPMTATTPTAVATACAWCCAIARCHTLRPRSRCSVAPTPRCSRCSVRTCRGARCGPVRHSSRCATSTPTWRWCRWLCWSADARMPGGPSGCRVACSTPWYGTQ